MNKDQNKQSIQEKEIKEPNSIAQNPNPRANENIQVNTEQANVASKNDNTDVGSEITDGEDA